MQKFTGPGITLESRFTLMTVLHASTRNRFRTEALALMIIAITALAVFLAPEIPDVGHGGDTTVYMGAAERFAAEGQLRAPVADWTDDRFPIVTHYAPLHIVVLSGFIRLGLSVENAARLARALNATVTLIIAFLLVRNISGAKAGVVAMILITLTPSLVFTHSLYMSEPLFVALTMSLVYLMWKRPERPFAYGVVAALSVLTRYIGLAFSGAVALWAFLQPAPLRQRMIKGTIALLPTVVLYGGWQLLTIGERGHATGLGVQAGVMDSMLRLVRAIPRWVAPLVAGGIWSATLKLALGASVLALVIGTLLRADPARRPEQQKVHRLLLVTVVLATSYYSLYVLARVFINYALDYHPRYWAPLEAVFGCCLASLAHYWFVSRRNPERWLPVAAVGLWATLAAAESAVLVRKAAREGPLWRARFEKSQLVDWARSNGQNRELFSNWQAVLFRYADRTSRGVPLTGDSSTVRRFGEVLRQREGTLVVFDDRVPTWLIPPGQEAHYLPPDSIARALNLRRVAQFDDGSVWDTQSALAETREGAHGPEAP